MKSIVLVLVLLMSFGSFAKGKSKGGASIINPTYMPGEGTVIIDGGFNYETTSYDYNETTGGANTKINDVDKNEAALDATVRFGISDRVEVGGSAGFVLNRSTQDQTQELISNGLKDLEAYGRYRIFKQSDKKFNLDVKATVSPGFLNREDPTKTNDGNVFRGGTALDIRGIMSQKRAGISWSAHFGLIYTGTITIYDADSGDESYNEEARMNVTIGGMGQFKLSPKFYFDAGLDLIRYDVKTTTIPGSSYEKTEDPLMQFILKTKAHFVFKPNLIFNGSFSFINNLDHQEETGSSQYEYITYRGFAFGAGATYKF